MSELKKCVQKNLSSNCVSELNSSLLEYLMRALSRRRRRQNGQQSSSSSERTNSSPDDDSDDNNDDDDDDENIRVMFSRPRGQEPCTTS